MKAKELAELLLNHPEAEIYYKDMNFGGKKEEFTIHNFEFDGEVFLIESLDFEYES